MHGVKVRLPDGHHGQDLQHPVHEQDEEEERTSNNDTERYLRHRRPGFKSCLFLLASRFQIVNGHDISSSFQMGIRFEISSRFQILNGPEISSRFQMGI